MRFGWKSPTTCLTVAGDKLTIAGAESVIYTANTALTAAGRQCNKTCQLRVDHVKARRTVCCCIELSGPERIEIIVMLATGNYIGCTRPNDISCLTHTVTLTATETGSMSLVHTVWKKGHACALSRTWGYIFTEHLQPLTPSYLVITVYSVITV